MGLAQNQFSVENAPLFYSEEELFNVKGKVTKIVNSLGLVTNAVVLWNTIYVQATLNHLRQQSFEVRGENEARLSPLVHGHVNMDQRVPLNRKVRFHIHTDAIKEKLTPEAIAQKKIGFVYAGEADLLNIALFGKTAKEWREKNPDLRGNIRDHATLEYD